MDTEEWKLEELKKRARRAKASNIETRVIESSKTVKRLEKISGLVLLLDVPCSGLGVLKRNPDAKWKLSPEFVQNVRELQQHIIQRLLWKCSSRAASWYTLPAALCPLKMKSR